jgi:DNA-binding CsgD family transcriptional regulator
MVALTNASYAITATRLRGTRRQRALATRLRGARPGYLTPQEWLVARLWADEYLTLDAIAARLGTTRPAVARLLRKTEDKLRAAERCPAFAGLPARLWRRLAHAGLSSPAAVAAVPDDALAAMTRLGPSGIAAVRAVIPYAGCPAGP